MTVAVSGLLEFERLCNRRNFIDESGFVRACVEFIQATTTLHLTPEYNHNDLPGNKRLDIVGRSKREGKLALAVEAKWIRPRGGSRYWIGEATEAALRLERINEEANAHTERALLIGGISQTIQARLIDQQINIGGGRRIVFPHILQPQKGDDVSFPYNQTKIDVRDCESDFNSFFTGQAENVGGRLPVSYQTALAGHHKSGEKQNSIEMYAWVIRRSRNRSDFQPE